MTRARRVIQVVEAELIRREKSLEMETSLNRIDISVIFGARTGNPVKVKMITDTETDLTAPPMLARVGGGR